MASRHFMGDKCFGIAGLKAITILVANLLTFCLSVQPSSGTPILFFPNSEDEASNVFIQETIGEGLPYLDSVKSLELVGFTSYGAAPDTGEQASILDSTSQKDKNEEILRVATIKVSNANVHAKPSTSSAILFRLTGRPSLKLIDKEGAWYLVDFPDGSVGWAHQSLFFKPHRTQLMTDGISKIVKAIWAKVTPGGEERVIFLLDGLERPKIFKIEGFKPRIVCDFFGALLGDGIGRSIDVNGRFIQRIRIALHESPESKVRVVLDLVPDSDSELSQIFSKNKHLYALVVGPRKR
jgi:SH3-like domain-containing protein